MIHLNVRTVHSEQFYDLSPTDPSKDCCTDAYASGASLLLFCKSHLSKALSGDTFGSNPRHAEAGNK
jgi:hypothetical protein